MTSAIGTEPVRSRSALTTSVAGFAPVRKGTDPLPGRLPNQRHPRVPVGLRFLAFMVGNQRRRRPPAGDRPTRSHQPATPTEPCRSSAPGQDGKAGPADRTGPSNRPPPHRAATGTAGSRHPHRPRPVPRPALSTAGSGGETRLRTRPWPGSSASASRRTRSKTSARPDIDRPGPPLIRRGPAVSRRVGQARAGPRARPWGVARLRHQCERWTANIQCCSSKS